MTIFRATFATATQTRLVGLWHLSEGQATFWSRGSRTMLVGHLEPLAGKGILHWRFTLASGTQFVGAFR